MKNLLFSALIACTLSTTIALAEEPSSSFVRLHGIDMLDGMLAPEQITKLNLLAHQVAIADACTNFKIDQIRFTDAFQTLKLPEDLNATDVQRDHHDKHLLVVFGVLVGGELAAIGRNAGAACDQASKAKTDPEFAKSTVWN
ncbi:hypothetical protein H7Q97_07035 [Ochrobactrum sp. CM-21-5]|nr:hypothetical protein [Ochrobactrum sp. CM-21-5]MBC2885155.1 hypothetical protein [Ochrobactrum sp. CM-21-5]